MIMAIMRQSGNDSSFPYQAFDKQLAIRRTSKMQPDLFSQLRALDIIKPADIKRGMRPRALSEFLNKAANAIASFDQLYISWAKFIT
jgi:hypothetical protein